MAIRANSTTMSAREVMRAAWTLYRKSAFARGRFDREAFGRALSMAWTSAKLAAERAAMEARWAAEEAAAEVETADVELSPMAAELVALEALPFRYDIAAQRAAIVARYALAA